MTMLPGLVDTVTVENPSLHSIDSEGRLTYTYDAPVDVVGCYAGMLDFRDQEFAAQNGAVYDAVIQFPKTAVVLTDARVTIPDVKGPNLAGVYRVRVVRWNPLTQRAFLERIVL